MNKTFPRMYQKNLRLSPRQYQVVAYWLNSITPEEPYGNLRDAFTVTYKWDTRHKDTYRWAAYGRLFCHPEVKALRDAIDANIMGLISDETKAEFFKHLEKMKVEAEENLQKTVNKLLHGNVLSNETVEKLKERIGDYGLRLKRDDGRAVPTGDRQTEDGERIAQGTAGTT